LLMASPSSSFSLKTRDAGFVLLNSCWLKP
jgi:hypothetical protein